MTKAYSYFGPPGTGKSTRIIKKMQECIDSGVPRGRIGLVSFTKAASTELAHRVGIKPGGNISTIHSMAFRMAGLVREQVVSNSELREFGDKIKIPIVGSNPDEGEFAEVGDSYLALYSKLKAQKRYPDELEQGYIEARIEGTMWQFEYFCKSYEKWKDSSGLIDFTDMLEMAKDHPAPDIDVLFVDEAQDLSLLQWDLIDHWSQDLHEIHIAGDDDQSIYVWGGADAGGMARFSREFDAKVEVLEQSYRIPANVHELAHGVIDNIQGERVEKIYNPTSRDGSIAHHSSVWTLGDLSDEEDTLVLYRNHSIREDMEDFLISRAIPYIVQGGKPGVLQSMYGKAIVLWQMISADWKNFQAVSVPNSKLRPLLTLAKHTLKAKIASSDLEDMYNLHWSEVINVPGHKAIYLKNLEKQFGKLDKIKPTIRLSTIHGSKGQEADRVILFNGMTERTYEAMSADFDSEVRTFYVGITRARRRLDIVLSKNPVPFLEV